MGILNPLIVARLRKYWECPKVELGELLSQLDGWIYILGPGPNSPTCDNCEKDLNFDWKLCSLCSYTTNAICNECHRCHDCTYDEDEDSEGCYQCGASCGAYMCQGCRAEDNY